MFKSRSKHGKEILTRFHNFKVLYEGEESLLVRLQLGFGYNLVEILNGLMKGVRECTITISVLTEVEL